MYIYFNLYYEDRIGLKLCSKLDLITAVDNYIFKITLINNNILPNLLKS